VQSLEKPETRQKSSLMRKVLERYAQPRENPLEIDLIRAIDDKSEADLS